ncbi:MAG: 3-ketoacyl-ACP reductase [Isosphaeraceae bacterium]
MDARVAVVTGGSRGIGRGIVRSLAGLGLRLVVHYRSQAEAAEEACREAIEAGAPEAIAIAADVGDIEQGRGLVDAVVDRMGRIDIWVNNAGVAPSVRLDLLGTTPESWERVVGTNLRGPFFLTQAVAKRMVEDPAPGDVRRLIVFVTSVSATLASVNRGEYCVSKAGLSMVAALFAARLADAGIAVHEVRPGIIDTDMTAGVHEVYDRRIADGLQPIRRWGTPEDVGRAVAALASGAFPFSTGGVFLVDGGLTLPRL